MRRALWIAHALAVTLVSAEASATSTGISGFSGKTLSCDNTGCHAGGEAPTVTLTGPDELAAGATGDFTLEVKTALTNGTAGIAGSDGVTLTAGTNLAAQSGGELSHSAPVAATGGAVTFTFKAKAPESGAEMTIFAAGLGSDGVGVTGDGTAKTTKKVTITGGKPAGSSSTSTSGGSSGGKTTDDDDRFTEDPFSEADAMATCGAAPGATSDQATAGFFLLAAVAIAIRGSSSRRRNLM
ncbi:MAG: hypothetical protein KIT84_29375 [Labilithrix sp.]|nr:hypothetical protein [Labilithrix sp.]MCW5815174.1 hypothetical protein [Labilithrix sp.]